MGMAAQLAFSEMITQLAWVVSVWSHNTFLHSNQAVHKFEY